MKAIESSVLAIKDKAKELRLKNRSYSEIGKELGINKETARRYVLDLSRIAKGEQKDPIAQVEEDSKVYRLRDESISSQRKYKELLKRYVDLEDRYAAVVEINSAVVNPIVIQPDPSNTKSEAVAIALASDWHVGQRIDGNTVNNINKYNPDICKKRATNYFKNLLKLIQKERQDVIIAKMILWLGGDFLSGLIHPELVEDNYLSPFEEVLFAQELITGGLNFLLDYGDFKEIIVPCSFGNHGRGSEKKMIATAHKNSFEWLLYKILAKVFENEPRLTFNVSDSYFSYMEIFGKTLRFHHGDMIKSGGGVGGVAIPLNKYIFKSNMQTQADLDLIGHFHQFTRGTNFIINGSLCGFDAYALSIGASPERPQQAFQLLDSKRGCTISAPILT